MAVRREVLLWGEKQLQEAGITDWKTDSWLLYEAASNMSRAQFFLNSREEMPVRERENYCRMIDRRCSHVPVQYITGQQEFMGFSFLVNEHVLIPRMDTEVLVLEAEKYMKGTKKVLDMCTGSGCIAVSLKKRNPQLALAGVDFSKEALKVARKNSERLKVPIDLYLSDLFEYLSSPVKTIIGLDLYGSLENGVDMKTILKTIAQNITATISTTGETTYSTLLNDIIIPIYKITALHDLVFDAVITESANTGIVDLSLLEEPGYDVDFDACLANWEHDLPLLSQVLYELESRDYDETQTMLDYLLSGGDFNELLKKLDDETVAYLKKTFREYWNLYHRVRKDMKNELKAAKKRKLSFFSKILKRTAMTLSLTAFQAIKALLLGQLSFIFPAPLEARQIR